MGCEIHVFVQRLHVKYRDDGQGDDDEAGHQGDPGPEIESVRNAVRRRFVRVDTGSTGAAFGTSGFVARGPACPAGWQARGRHVS
jgi:hypothetical protein